MLARLGFRARSRRPWLREPSSPAPEGPGNPCSELLVLGASAHAHAVAGAEAEAGRGVAADLGDLDAAARAEERHDRADRRIPVGAGEPADLAAHDLEDERA